MKYFLVFLCSFLALCQICIGGDDSSSQEEGSDNSLKDLQKNVSSLWTYVAGMRRRVEHDLHQLHQHQMEVGNKLKDMFGVELEHGDGHMHHMNQEHAGDHAHEEGHRHDDNHSHEHHDDHHDGHHDDHHDEHNSEHQHGGDHHHHDEHNSEHQHGGDHHHHDEHNSEHQHGGDHHHHEDNHHDDHHSDHHDHHQEEDHHHDNEMTGHGHDDHHHHPDHDHHEGHNDSAHSHASDSHHHEHSSDDNRHRDTHAGHTDEGHDHAADNDTSHTSESHHHQHHQESHHQHHQESHHHRQEHESHHHHHHSHHDSHPHSSKYEFAVCDIEPNTAIPLEKQQNITGRINLWQQKNGTTLHIHIKIKGFEMDGHDDHQATGENQHPAQHIHGFHVHQEGDLSNSCQSTGPHFNPTAVQHGGPSSTVRHVGDLGNIRCNQHGVTNSLLTDKIASLHGENSIIGKSIVIHERNDDLGVNPDNPASVSSGDAGTRIACCVIRRVERLSRGHSHGHHQH